jgi:hypothetical protein
VAAPEEAEAWEISSDTTACYASDETTRQALAAAHISQGRGRQAPAHPLSDLGGADYTAPGCVFGWLLQCNLR